MRFFLLHSLFVLCLISTPSCQKYELTYSCDPTIETWVTENMQRIKSMSSGNWQAVSDIEYQRGIYRAFSPEQKLRLWTDKLQDALTLAWNDQEKGHIETLISLLNISIFEGTMNDGTYIKLYKWINYASEILKWDQETIYSLVYTPQLLTASKKIPESYFVTAKTRSEDGGRKTCNCGDAHGILACYHPYASYNCRIAGVDCAPSDNGCGMLWLEKCWGVCYA